MTSAVKAAQTGSLLRRLLSILNVSERWQAAGLALLALTSAMAEAVGIGAVFPLLSLLTHREAMLQDSRVKAVYAWSGAESYEQFVLLATAALLLLFVVKNVLVSAVYYAQARFICNAESRIGTDLLAAYLYAPYLERVEQNSADRIRVITSEVARVTAGFLMPLVNLTAEALVVLMLIVLLLVVQPQSAGLAILLIGAVGVLVQVAFRRRINHERQERVVTNSTMFRTVAEGLGALKETKVLGREQHFVQRYLGNSRRYARATTVFMTMNLLPRVVIETAAVAALAGCIAATILTKQPLDTIVPVLTVFGLAAVRIMPSATRMLGAANNLRYYAPSVREVSSHVYAAQTLPRDTVPRAVADREPLQTIELRTVSYTYPGSTVQTLTGVDVQVARGEVVALTGRSGSGKTTLADIMLGLVAPDAGDVLVNGRPVSDLRGELGSFAGLVPQYFYILDDSVRRNVAFGIPEKDIDDDKVWRALELARLADRIRSGTKGLDEPTGENGALLSGGERQRLAIARAVYHDPGLLIFDEATSALDAGTESEIVETIAMLALSKAVLVIAHRPALLRCATRILHLEDGRVSRVEGGREQPRSESLALSREK